MMTIEERKEQERKQKEWVKARLNCTIKAVYTCLVTNIRYDVNIYNDSGIKPEFEVVDIDGIDGVVIRNTTSNKYAGKDYVTVRIKDSCLEISRNEKREFTVKPKWDQAALECKLLVENDNDAPLSYPQISQKAIGGLLFKGPDYPPAM